MTTTIIKTIECPTCAGCGRVADDDDQTPWCYWEEIPAPSNLAVVMGIVKPITCPTCDGKKTVEHEVRTVMTRDESRKWIEDRLQPHIEKKENQP